MTPPHNPTRNRIHADAQKAIKELDAARVDYLLAYDQASLNQPTQAEEEQARKQLRKARKTYSAANNKCILAVQRSLHIYATTGW